MKKLFFLPVLLLGIAGLSQTGNKIVQMVNPPSVATPNGYSHAAVIDLGTCTMLILSGQVGLDNTGKLAGNDLEAQADQVFKNIQHIVKSAGGTMQDVVKLNYFVLDVSQIQQLRNIRDKYIYTQKPPASTLVQVSKLFRGDILIEVEATAIIPKK